MPQRISLAPASAPTGVRPGLRTLLEREHRQHAVTRELEDLAALGVDRVDDTIKIGVESSEIGLKCGARG